MVNIFYLHRNIKTCSRHHCNKHVNKMIIESTQLLSHTNRLSGGSEAENPYSLGHHKKHPCALWVTASLSNWRWLRDFTLALNEEYMFRYQKTEDHKSAAICKLLKVCFFRFPIDESFRLLCFTLSRCPFFLFCRFFFSFSCFFSFILLFSFSFEFLL